MHKALALGFATFSLLAAVPAHAGYKGTNGLYIDTNSRVALGSLADVRNDGNPASWIRISIESTATYFAANVMFRDSLAHPPVGCSTSNPGMVQTLAAATNDALVTVYWDANGQCTSVQVDNSSYLTPKTP